MKLTLTFKGQRLVVTNRPELVIAVETLDLTLDDMKRLWEMEQAFNELTKGRLHLNLVE